MPKRWGLVDIDDNVFTFTDNAFKILAREWQVDLDVIERSFRAGADFPGIQRDKSASLDYEYDENHPDEQVFRTRLNTLKYQLRKVVKIRDLINNTETDCLLENDSIGYDEGGFNLGSRNSVSFRQLRPYWRDVDFSEEIETGETSGIIIINNNGYVDIPVIITVTALEPTTKFSFRIAETGEGILIKDLEFGLNGLNTYIIDSRSGTAELNQINRNQKIEDGTGPFNLRVGVNTIIITSNGSLNILIQYKKEYYV